jgi:Flp pilus assembly protein TadG
MSVIRIKDAIRTFLNRENGTQMIEFAIIFPVLIMLFAGTTELGRMFYTCTSLAKATRSGARYLSTVPNVGTSTTAAKNMVMCGDATGCGTAGHPPVILPNLTANNIVITPPVTGVAVVKYVKVEITGYTYQPLVFNLNSMIGGNVNIPLSPGTRMRYMLN